MMSLCDYPNFYLSQLKMMTSCFSTIVPSFNFFNYGPGVTDGPTVQKLDWTRKFSAKNESKINNFE